MLCYQRWNDGSLPCLLVVALNIQPAPSPKYEANSTIADALQVPAADPEESDSSSATENIVAAGNGSINLSRFRNEVHRKGWIGTCVIREISASVLQLYRRKIPREHFGGTQ